MLQKLKDLYRQYDEQIRSVKAKARPTDGLLGMGNDPRNHPCHIQFYEGVQQWIRDFLEADSDGQASLEAARWIIGAPAAHKDGPTFWFEYAAHGLCKDLVARVDGQGCRELLALFEANYPRRDRLPVQDELYKLLKKNARKK